MKFEKRFQVRYGVNVKVDDLQATLAGLPSLLQEVAQSEMVTYPGTPNMHARKTQFTGLCVIQIW